MYRPYTALCLAGLAGTLAAQPTLQATQLFPPVGTTYPFNISAYQAPVGSGPNYTWDFSGLVITSTFSEQYVAPENGSQGQNYPDADIAINAPGIPTRYRAYSSTTGAMDLGNAFSFNWVVYDDGAVLLPPSVTYQGTWTDAFSGYSNNDFGEGCDITGTVAGVADAWGTLSMPYGVVEDVLRLHIVIQYANVCTTGTSETTETHDLYFDQLTAEPLVSGISVSVAVDGGPGQVVSSGLYWIANSTEGIGQHSAAAPFTVFPNPAHGTVRIDAAQAVRVELFDAQGRLVRTRPFASGMAVLDLTGLPASVYLASVTDRDSKRRQQRIVVE